MRKVTRRALPAVRRRPPTACCALLLGVLVLATAPPAGAQAPSGETGGAAASGAAPQAPVPIGLEQVPVRAERTRTELAALLPKAEGRRSLERMGSEIDTVLLEVEAILRKAREALLAEPPVNTLQLLQSELAAARSRLLPRDARLDEQLAGIRRSLDRVDTIDETWKQAAELARRERAGDTVLSRIAAVRGEIRESRAKILEHRAEVLALRDRLVDPSSAVSATLEEVELAIADRLQGILRLSRPPLWSPEVRASLAEEWREGPVRDLRERGEEGAAYLQGRRSQLAFQLALFVALGLAMRMLRERARTRAEDDYDLRVAQGVFEHPWSMALLIFGVFADGQHPFAPPLADLGFSLLLATAALRIGRRFLPSAMDPVAWGLAAFFVIDSARDLMETTPTLERVVFVAEMLAALFLLAWLLRPSRLASIPYELRRAGFLRVLGTAMRIAFAIVGFALLADLVGLGDLASLLGNGALQGGYLGFFAFVLFQVVRSLATFALVLWPLRLLRSISRHRLLVRRRLERLLVFLATAAWAFVILARIGLLAQARDLVGGLLGAGVSVGALSVTLGDIAAFAVVVWGSFVLARLVNFLLAEDVFTRVEAGRGVPYAIAGFVRYTVIFLGFLVGLAAAGVELSKLTVVAGGLGVGIGFGLQNVVNNFVSGLILLFERPVQVGDAVQLADASGDIKSIGIRASVILTYDGAEVIVPNSMLISDKVTNWTFSNRRRRVEVDVGVSYGTSAEQVLGLLLDVAQGNENVLQDPEPRAFFMAFGDSALLFRLRAWIPNFDAGFQTRSDLTVAVQQALDRAGIEVPFPQRDLHLRSVSPNLRPEGEGSG